MKNMPTLRWLLGTIINPGWAPLTVVIIHVILSHYGLIQFDAYVHFAGGAAIAFFFHGSIAKLPPSLAIQPKWTHYLLAFTSACTAAVFWEFSEFIADYLMRTAIQQSLTETIQDLACGVAGALTALLLIYFAATLRSERHIAG